MVDGEIVGLLAKALASTIGVKIPAADAEAATQLRQRIMRQLQRLGDLRPPVSVLTRRTPSGEYSVLVVKSELMKGKALDVQAAIARLTTSEEDPPGPPAAV